MRSVHEHRQRPTGEGILAFLPEGLSLGIHGCRKGIRTLDFHLRRVALLSAELSGIASLLRSVARRGFEPLITCVRGRRPSPLDERALM